MKYFACISLLILSFSCQPKMEEVVEKEENTFDYEAEMASIEETRAAVQLAIKEKRYEDLRQFGHPGIITLTPICGEWEEYKRLRANPNELFSYDSIAMTPRETVILNDSMAYDFGTSVVYYTNGEGEPTQITDTFLAIVRKDKNDGRWKLFREVATTNMLK